MGLISRLFRGKYDLEDQLENLYVHWFQTMEGMSFSEARDTARGMIEQAKQESEKEGTARLPKNLGNILLDKEATDEKIKSMLTKLRQEGVNDEDIRWWWNMHDLERRMMQVDYLRHRYILFLKLQEDGLGPEESAKGVAKRFPIFGNPDDNTLSGGNDRPIPWELKNRVDLWIQKGYKMDPEKFKKRIDYSTSVNSLIRKSIERGNL